jgi:hypothetical protein
VIAGLRVDQLRSHAQAVRVPAHAPLEHGRDTEGVADRKTLFMASTRAGGQGGIDIWMARRAGSDDPWGEPVNVGAPVNTEFNDFCPTIARNGHDFFFVSNRPGVAAAPTSTGAGSAPTIPSRSRSTWAAK